MKIKTVVEAGQQHMLDPVSQLRRDRALGVARESAVEVALVNRRGPQTGHGRREIDRGQNDQPALDVRWLQIADQVAEPNLALPLVAMVTSHHQDAGSFAILDARDRYRNPAIGRTLHRVRNPHKAAGLARGMQINVCAKGAACRHSVQAMGRPGGSSVSATGFD